MTALAERLRAEATARGESLAHAVRHHLMGGVIERIARSPEADAFVLRGGMLTRAWLAPRPRPTRDLDYVGDFPFDLDDTVRRVLPALAMTLDDGVQIDPAKLTAQRMWEASGFPGIRLGIAIGLDRADQRLTVDIGFGDPLVPAATPQRIQRVTSDVVVRACRPETQLAWKLHGLAELGTSWRPKDLADLWLITRHVALVAADLPPAIDAAFTSRGFTHADAARALRAPHWATKTARVRWGEARGPLPELAQTVADLLAMLPPALAVLNRPTLECSR